MPPTCLQVPPIDMTSERPFKITVSDDALALLNRKLDDTCLPDEVKAAEWAYGVPLADIRRLLSRRDGYEWRTHERKLNALPMFTRTIAVDEFGELNVHYVHQRSAVEGAIPLLFVHGCTSSTMLPAEPLINEVIADMVCRARKLLRGDEGAATPDGGFCGAPIIPRCCAKFSWICLVGRGAGEGLSGKALCRGNPRDFGVVR